MSGLLGRARARSVGRAKGAAFTTLANTSHASASTATRFAAALDELNASRPAQPVCGKDSPATGGLIHGGPSAWDRYLDPALVTAQGRDADRCRAQMTERRDRAFAIFGPL